MDNVSIKIEYKLSNSDKWYLVEFLPDEYFDLEPNEEVEWDCVPLYNDTLDYLDIDKTLVKFIKTTIIDIENNISQVFTETFWNQGNNRIIETNITGSKLYQETIIDIKLKNDPPTWELLRYTKENNLPKLSYHGFFKDNDDGSQEEEIIY